MDLSKLSDADLLALQSGDLTKVSDSALRALQAAGQYEADKELYSPTNGMSGVEKFLAGTGKAFVDTARGLGQFVGAVSRDDVAESRARDAPLMRAGAARAGNIFGNVAAVAPTSLIPGAATVPGAALIGGAVGLAQPSTSTGETLLNAGLGFGVGGAGQLAANKISSVLSQRLATKTAEEAARKSQNAVKDATLKEGREAGYVLPKSEVAPTFMANRIESFGGKAAVRQEATMRNQQTTNALTRKALGIPDDAPLSQGTLDGLRKTAGKTYQEVSELSPQAASDLEALKVARNEAQGWFNAYNRSMRPDDLAKAKAARETADQLESALEGAAIAAGKNDLVPALRQARKQIAKTYTVERALNKGSGDIDARVLGRLYDKGKPLSDGLDTIGKFNQAYPKFTGPAPSTQTPGVNYLDALSMPSLSAIGAMATGSPTGLLAGGLPLLRGPARSLALSKVMQASPKYGAGLLDELGGGLSPTTLGLLPRTAIPSGLLSTE